MIERAELPVQDVEHQRTLSTFRFPAGRGVQFSGRPPQQCAVRYSTKPFIAENRAD
jgi:hypothetical protein